MFTGLVEAKVPMLDYIEEPPGARLVLEIGQLEDASHVQLVNLVPVQMYQ